jgi:hypothetical protein
MGLVISNAVPDPGRAPLPHAYEPDLVKSFVAMASHSCSVNVARFTATGISESEPCPQTDSQYECVITVIAGQERRRKPWHHRRTADNKRRCHLRSKFDRPQ